MTDNKNTILAIVLSAVVLIAWQYFYAMPQAEKQKQLAQQQQQSQPVAPPTGNAQSGVAPASPGTVPPTRADSARLAFRSAPLAEARRVKRRTMEAPM